MLADYALKTLDLWFWFGAFVSFAYLPVLYEADPKWKKGYDAAVKMARAVSPWLVEQFSRTLAQEQAEMERNQPMPPNGDVWPQSRKRTN
jgi:acyl-homoserine lactone acylase PvdQ